MYVYLHRQVSFHSDYSVTGPAFTLSWRSLNMTTCRSQTLREPSASFASFNFPRPFPDHFRCFVLVLLPPGSRVLLRFSRILLFNDQHPRDRRSLGLDLGGSWEAKEDDGQGEDGQGEGELMIGVEDDDEEEEEGEEEEEEEGGGSILRRVFVSVGNSLRIRMERRAVLAGEGFQATYSTGQCLLSV